MNEEEKRKRWREDKREYRNQRKEYVLILSREDARRLEVFATAKHMSPQEFIKALLGAYTGDSGYVLPADSVLKDLVLEIRRIGNNINQVARHVNADASVSLDDIRQLKRQLETVEQKIVQAVTNPEKIPMK